MADIGEGLYLTVGGMGLVFFSLAVLWLVITVLERGFRPKEGDVVDRVLTSIQPEAATPISIGVSAEYREAVAAISVALAKFGDEGKYLSAGVLDKEAVAAVSAALARLGDEGESIGAGEAVDKKAVAAISVALAKLQGEQPQNNVKSDQSHSIQQASPWRISGRQRMMNLRR